MNGTRRPPRGAGFAFEMGLRSLDEQLRRLEALDTKAGVMIAAGGILAGLLFSRGSLVLSGPQLLTATSATAMVASMLLALLAFATRGYETAPDPEFVARFASATEEGLRSASVGLILAAYALNRRTLARKDRLLGGALGLLLVAITVLGGYFLYALFTDGLGSG